jgi:para-aminobenzoate synthetase component 1
MTHCTTNIKIKPISLSKTEFSNIKNQIAQSHWGAMLESANDSHDDSRWSIYCAQPIATLETRHGKIHVQEKNQHSEQMGDPFKILETLRTKLFHELNFDLDLPFTGGALGYIAYELGYQLEQISNSDKPLGLELPEMAIGFYDWALLFDNLTAQFSLLVHKTKENQEDIESLWIKRFNWLTQQSKNYAITAPFKLNSDWSSNMNKREYREKFNKVQDYILSGDCYQVNLTQRFQASYQGDEYQAYQTLLADNHPPFAAFLRLPSQSILSLSPERFLKLELDIIESKPIKGTCPRYLKEELDNKSRQKLSNSQKDRAENLMIVDLMRNDIGRVCLPGTVSVPKLFAIESFPAVHHLVSTVLGRLAPNYSSEDLLRACFPGGSITGAPKIRAMEVIAELEPNSRQIYCGSIGYINGNGVMDMNISIRTLVCHKQQIYCWAGGGLVADSNVDQEYQECFDKLSKILPSLAALNR